MKVSLIFFPILLHLGLSCMAQPNDKYPFDQTTMRSVNRQLINKNDTIYRFYAILPEHRVYAYPDRVYYWFFRDSIFITVGGYDGRLLDGSYTVFYPDKNLAEQGQFAAGLRTGEWRSWYPDGMIHTIMHWQHGQKEGVFTDYDLTGKKLREGKYKKDRLSGKIKEYSPDGKFHKVRYRDGFPEEPTPETKTDKKEESGKEGAVKPHADR